MIRINQIKLPLHHTEEQLIQKIAKELKISEAQIISWQIVKKSIDARKKPELMYVYAADVETEQEEKILKKVNNNNIMSTVIKRYHLPSVNKNSGLPSPVIIGTGPAGLFCAYALVLRGISPLVIERGKKVDERTLDVTRFWKDGILNPSSNVQFGEGGAGTFSDGKLNTLVKDPLGRNRFVLETFVRFGAPERILFENKPHIGTDVLVNVVKNMRCWMEENGASFRFETCMTNLKTIEGRLTSVEFDHREELPTETLILAIGHSARDTFRMLSEKEKIGLETKSFAVGFRLEHPQAEINRGQYGDKYYNELPAAPYKLTAHTGSGRGVYSFCMCPGGYVVNASSEPGQLAVNGMSYSAREGKNANSAIIVSVNPQDFPGQDALSGVRFQEQLEKSAFHLGNGKIPQQLFGDFCKNKPSGSYGSFPSQTKGNAVLCNLRGLLPAALEEAFMEGMHRFSRSIFGFDREDAILSGVESRTSSPVRIPRNDRLMAGIFGIYPCGEGAGYAGGIMSAAMDGLKVAEAVLKEQKTDRS